MESQLEDKSLVCYAECIARNSFKNSGKAIDLLRCLHFFYLLVVYFLTAVWIKCITVPIIIIFNSSILIEFKESDFLVTPFATLINKQKKNWIN